MERKRIVLTCAAAVLTLGVSLGACSSPSATPAKPSVAACTKAYPAWYLASLDAHQATGQNTPTATPAACKGLSDSQIDKIATDYLVKQS